MFAQACDALVRERDRVFLTRIADDYKIDFAELEAKYLSAAEEAVKVPRKYKKREPKAVNVVGVTEEGEKPAKVPKAKAEKQCCTAQTSKKDACKFSALKGEVFCKRHLKQSLGETEPKAAKVPKVKKAPKKTNEIVHSHALDSGVHADCDLCQSHGNPMAGKEDEFELVTEEAEEAEEEAPVPKVQSVQERLAALLAEEPDSDAEDDAKLEDYEEED